MQVILNDGTVIEGGEAGLSSMGNLWIWVPGYTMPQAAMMFLDPEKTGRIIFRHESTDEVFEGYINCTFISVEETGKIRICMQKGADDLV